MRPLFVQWVMLTPASQVLYSFQVSTFYFSFRRFIMETKPRLKNTAVHMLPFWWAPPLDLVSCVVWQFTSLCSSCVAWRLPQLTLNTMTLKLLLRTESRLEHLQLFRFIMYEEEGCLLLHRNLQLLYPTSPSSSYSLSHRPLSFEWRIK